MVKKKRIFSSFFVNTMLLLRLSFLFFFFFCKSSCNTSCNTSTYLWGAVPSGNLTTIIKRRLLLPHGKQIKERILLNINKRSRSLLKWQWCQIHILNSTEYSHAVLFKQWHMISGSSSVTSTHVCLHLIPLTSSPLIHFTYIFSHVRTDVCSDGWRALSYE